MFTGFDEGCTGFRVRQRFYQFSARAYQDPCQGFIVTLRNIAYTATIYRNLPKPYPNMKRCSVRVWRFGSTGLDSGAW